VVLDDVGVSEVTAESRWATSAFLEVTVELGQTLAVFFRGNSRVMLGHVGVLEVTAEWCLMTSVFQR
jgi:hypothetical protein